MEWGWDNARALIGIVVIFVIAWGLSENKKKFPLKIVLGAVAIQFLFALILFGVPPVREALFKVNDVVSGLIDATAYGTAFVTFVLQRTGAQPDDPTVSKGVDWLKANQRTSGRWFARSLYKDSTHYLSHAATAMAVMAIRTAQSN